MTQSRILFVCTGNIFRSMIAEYALKAHAATQAGWSVGSAGTEALPQEVHFKVKESLLARGIDISSHAQRRVSHELLAEQTLVIAMGLDHQHFLSSKFGVRAPLFNQVAYGESTPVLDVDEAVPDYRTNEAQALLYIHKVVGRICDGMPSLIERAPAFISEMKR